MIVIDTSAILAVVLSESDSAMLLRRMLHADRLMISAGTLVELLIVSSRDAGTHQDVKLFASNYLTNSIEPVTAEQALIAGEAYRQFGKGHHKARLNLGDVFAYSLAKLNGLPLLFKGNDFALTDITPA